MFEDTALCIPMLPKLLGTVEADFSNIGRRCYEFVKEFQFLMPLMRKLGVVI